MVPNLFAAFAGFDEQDPIRMAVGPSQTGVVFMELVAEDPDGAHGKAYLRMRTRNFFSTSAR
jgi:hypothetical protein